MSADSTIEEQITSYKEKYFQVDFAGVHRLIFFFEPTEYFYGVILVSLSCTADLRGIISHIIFNSCYEISLCLRCK